MIWNDKVRQSFVLWNAVWSLV